MGYSIYTFHYFEYLRFSRYITDNYFFTISNPIFTMNFSVSIEVSRS
jgi:hypothetical protein